jgi:hypothetical protein
MMLTSDIWLNLLTGSTVAVMGCVVAAVLGGYDFAWFGAAAAAVLFVVSYFECLWSIAADASSAGLPETAEADGT